MSVSFNDIDITTKQWQQLSNQLATRLLRCEQRLYLVSLFNDGCIMPCFAVFNDGYLILV